MKRLLIRSQHEFLQEKMNRVGEWEPLRIPLKMFSNPRLVEADECGEKKRNLKTDGWCPGQQRAPSGQIPAKADRWRWRSLPHAPPNKWSTHGWGVWNSRCGREPPGQSRLS